MKTKTAITLIGSLNIIQGIAFYFGAETLTKQSFPADMLTKEAIEVGTAMHWPLAMSVTALGIIILFTRNIPTEEAKKVLLGIGIAYTFFLFNGLAQHFTTPVNVPMPALITLALAAILAFYTSQKAQA